MLAFLFWVGLRWVLIGAGLLVAWYILAPLFTPRSLKQRPPQAKRRRTRKGEDFEVIEGKGRLID